MIRLLLVLVVLVGAVYLLLIRSSGEEEPELRYRENLEKAESLEQQIFREAENLDRKIDEKSQ